MISKSMSDMLNRQIELEAYASFYYLSMASWCDQEGLEGCAQFFNRQSTEEHDHMMRIFNYLLDMDVTAQSPGVDKPPIDFESVQQVFKDAYAHEKKVTESINSLVNFAIQENDHATHNFLQWYVQEQREEEALMRLIQDKIKIIGAGAQSLYFIDKEIEEINKMQVKQEASGG